MVVVEGSDDNEVAANAIKGGELGVIVDTADRNLVALNHIDGAADGILVAGRREHRGQRRRRRQGRLRGLLRLRDRRLSGTGNVVKANLVTRSAADGINVAAGTWVGLNVALRNAGRGINAVRASTDGGGNRGAAATPPCAGVTCRAPASARRAPRRPNASAISS